MADSPEIDAILKLVNIVAGVSAVKGLHEAFQADVFVVLNLPRQLTELLRHLVGELPERELQGLDVLPARVGGELVGGLFDLSIHLTLHFSSDLASRCVDEGE
ncbi:N-methylhydantoinase B, putative [Babesia ovata]|uniref:N-methylhydantoinase B, putative n=1 Tax=Babesia ovata TaxID=189622 RepID=A0A2H6KKI5_9APIC|nr:N-methylhydantoinase B, putative [Babesia ovata]GBE63501.1 N-methylhydantoinase B, putative [Babesia ovata]